MAPSELAAAPKLRERERLGGRLKIAILLPPSAMLRTIRRAGELASALLNAESTQRHAVEITVGVSDPDGQAWRYAERQIRRRVPSAIVRHLEWTRVPVKNARRMFADLPRSLDLEGINEVAVPRDWGWNFQDCDLWISMANPGVGAILPLRPTTHYCSELAQRYVPTAITGSIHDPYWINETEAFRIWRQGLVVTSDPGTAVDLVSYAGVRRERIEVVPDVLDSLARLAAPEAADRDQSLLLWLLRGNALDDLQNCLEGLSTYFREGGQLDILLAHDARAPADNHLGAVTLPSDLLELYKSLPRFPYRSLDELDRMIPRVGAIWSSQVAGGEAEHVHDAVRAGVPLITPRFALNEREVERLGANALFYELNDPLGVADSLRAIESIAEGEQNLTEDSKEPAKEIDQRVRWGFLLDRMLEHSYAD